MSSNISSAMALDLALCSFANSMSSCSSLRSMLSMSYSFSSNSGLPVLGYLGEGEREGNLISLGSSKGSSRMTECLILIFSSGWLRSSTWTSLSLLRMSRPSHTYPKIVCFWLRVDRCSSVSWMKKFELFRFGPMFEVATRPSLSC